MTIDDNIPEPTIEEGPVLADPFREGRGVERTVRWTRTITVEGPADWVRDTWVRALADGVHILGTKRGLQCRIEVTTNDWESVRGLHGATSNQAMDDLRTNHPDLYEAVHGDGTARAHGPTHVAGDHDVAAAAHPKPEAAHVGQYL